MPANKYSYCFPFGVYRYMLHAIGEFNLFIYIQTYVPTALNVDYR